MRGRESNIELMRIVAMLFIVMHHFIYHGLGLYDSILNSQYFQPGGVVLINSFLIVGVDLFILISGYFKIKFKISGIVKLYLLCSFWGGFTYICASIINNNIISVPHVFSIMLFPFSRGAWWFINSYFCLYLLSPFLNRIIERDGRKAVVLLMVALGVINIYLGWFHGQESLKTGYNFVNFILLYSIGAYIRTLNISCNNKWWFLSGYITLSLFLGVIATILNKTGHPSKMLLCFSYNNPFVLVSSVLLFCFFASLKAKYKFTTYITPYLLAVYLFQDGGLNLYKIIGNLDYSSDYLKNTVIWICAVIVSFVIPLSLEWIRERVMRYMTRKLSKLISNLTFRIGLTDKEGCIK